jgi:hypothetical protein
MSYDNLVGLRISAAGGVATVTLDHPPLNLMDGVPVVTADVRHRESSKEVLVALVEHVMRRRGAMARPSAGA